MGGITLRKVYILLLALTILNLVDYLTTMMALSHGAVEGNIIANYFINHNTLHYLKLGGLGFLCIYLIHAAKRDLRSRLRVIRVLRWANLAYSFIAVSNVVVYFVQKYQN